MERRSFKHLILLNSAIRFFKGCPSNFLDVTLSVGLDSAFPLNPASRFPLSFFFFGFHAFKGETKFTVHETKNTVHALFMYCLRTVHGSHNTIHTFKNYFATMFSVFSFSNNKFNLNGPLISPQKLTLKVEY